MFYDEIEIGEVGRSVVDIVHVKRILAKRVNRGTLVHVQVLDTQLLTQFEVLVGPWIVQTPTPGTVTPLCRVQLEALDRIRLDHLLKLVQASFFVSRIEGTVEDETLRMFFLQHMVLFMCIKTIREKFV